jgi:hypothetical protein
MSKLGAFCAFLLFAGATAFSIPTLGRFLGFGSPWLALNLMVCFLGLMALARPFYRLRLPGWLRALRAWETDGRYYRLLAVPQFGVLLRSTPLRLLNRDVYLAAAGGVRSSVLVQLETAEAAHWGAALLLMPYLLSLVKNSRWSMLFWLVAVQVVVNVYPILHLRWVRCRLQRLATRRLAG